ncbi:MAG TPA: prephenate dehydratase [Solirubrobacteraceae bacterium]|nr:prephenate dehydratase [Solirubrobacteraceae bacterium]
MTPDERSALGDDGGGAPASRGPATQPPTVGFLGPAGTFTEEALLSSVPAGAVQPVPFATIYDTALAVREGTVRWAVVPIENSLEGSVTVTLDLLADERGDLEIVGEVLLSIEHALIAAAPCELSAIETVLSHPQAPGQCTRLLRNELAHARVVATNSTAEAVRRVVAEGDPGRAALGTRLAAEIYGGTVLREAVQDRDDNVTRFVWLARRPAASDAGEGDTASPPWSAGSGREWKTSLVFWGPGAEHPGWLVRCLEAFARREINLTKIESRPRRSALGHYVFFLDAHGERGDPRVAEAIAALGAVCEHVRVLGSYRAG